jgi:hypothetical protein
VRDDGIVEALTLGEGDVLASFEKLSSGRVLIAVPTGRFKLSVDVHDGVIPAQSVVDARVEVLSGARDVRAVTNSWSSITRLYGVPRDVDIRVSKDGYTSVTQRLRLDRLSTLVHVSLVPSIDRPTLTGLYRMTVASAACADGSELPDVARTREYEAHVWEPGGKVSVRLDGADLVPKVCASGGCFGGDGLSFHGVVQALDAVLTLAAYDPGWDWDDWLYPSVVERLPDGVLLSFSGLALLRPTRDGFDGTLDGSIDLFRTSSLAASGVTPSASCRSSRHRLTFRR